MFKWQTLKPMLLYSCAMHKQAIDYNMSSDAVARGERTQAATQEYSLKLAAFIIQIKNMSDQKNQYNPTLNVCF